MKMKLWFRKLSGGEYFVAGFLKKENIAGNGPRWNETIAACEVEIIESEDRTEEYEGLSHFTIMSEGFK